MHACVYVCVLREKIKADSNKENQRQKKKTWLLRVLGYVFFKWKLMESNITAETLSSLLSVRAFE